jgi:flavin-dependent dehydrogenase
METIDLLIIGAGPAGLSTAMHLIQGQPAWAGRMLILEQAVHPRSKLCGGAVTRLGLGSLQKLGFSLPLPLPQAQVDEARLVYGKRTIHVHGRPAFIVFERAEFDAYLAGQARQRGVRIRENERAESLSIGPTGVQVSTNRAVYRARMVVGADGSKGLALRVIRAANAKPRAILPHHRAAAAVRSQPPRLARLLEVLQPAVESAPPFADRFAVFNFTLVAQALQGYFWDFPARKNGCSCFNRGLYDARLASNRPTAHLTGLLEHALASLSGETAPAQLQGHPIHWFSPRNRFAVPRLLLVGDAAGADPLFGEGIAPALEYGQLAAATIQQAFEQDDFTLRDYRRRILLSPLGGYLLARWLVAWWGYRLCGHAWFMHLLWSLGALLAAAWPLPQPLFPEAENPGSSASNVPG